MSVSRKSSKSNGRRSWLSDIVANTPTMSKKRSTNGMDHLNYKNGTGSIRSTSTTSTPIYPIITGSFTDNQSTLPISPAYPIITSTLRSSRSTSLQQKPFQSSNYPSPIKASTLRPRKKSSGRQDYNEDSFIISEDYYTSGVRDGKKHSTTPTLIQEHGQETSVLQHPTTVTSTLYDSVALDIPSMSKGYKSNKTNHQHVGHFKKNEQKKTFLDSGCKTLDRNHFSRIRVS